MWILLHTSALTFTSKAIGDIAPQQERCEGLKKTEYRNRWSVSIVHDWFFSYVHDIN